MNAVVMKLLIEYVLVNVEEISRNKHSGVHCNQSTYRVHKSHVIPRVLDTRGINEVIASAVEELQDAGFLVEWDPHSLWFTVPVNDLK
jgi:hypothetical protein